MPCRKLRLSGHGISDLHERTVNLAAHEREWWSGDRPRKHRLPRAERHGGDGYGDLVQQSLIVELAHEAPAAHQPHVLSLRRVDHGPVDRRDLAAHEPDVAAGHSRNRPRAEPPAGLA